MNSHLLVSIKQIQKKDYPIYLGKKFQEWWIQIIKKRNYSKHFMITDKNVYNIYKSFLERFQQDLNTKKIIILNPGEDNKHIKKTYPIYEELIKNNIDRKSVIIAFGGGVIGDFSGFIASTILRGVHFIQIPTTLLSMVDASIGGKVAVNVNLGKNMVGCFFQPEMVFCNMDFLKTLPEKEWICGLAEIIKHSLLNRKVYISLKKEIIKEPNYKNWKEEVWQKVIYDSITVKAKIVSKDEKEANLRSVLNLGHTVGHAIESLTNYKKFSHGETVSRGLITALLISKKKLNFPEKEFKDIINLMTLLNLPLNTARFSAKEIWEHLQYDKKNQYNKVKYILLKKIGSPVYNIDLHWNEFESAWKEQKELFG
ncbi:MAG: 3-dehydroquinate synthase [Leptonema sp. (in: bacteria)]